MTLSRAGCQTPRVAAHRFDDRWFEAESRYPTLGLRESNDVLQDSAALAVRLAEDGYLFIRALHDPDEVQAASAGPSTAGSRGRASSHGR